LAALDDTRRGDRELLEPGQPTQRTDVRDLRAVEREQAQGRHRRQRARVDDRTTRERQPLEAQRRERAQIAARSLDDRSS